MVGTSPQTVKPSGVVTKMFHKDWVIAMAADYLASPAHQQICCWLCRSNRVLFSMWKIIDSPHHLCVEKPYIKNTIAVHHINLNLGDILLNYFYIIIKIRWQVCFARISFLAIWLLQIFAHASTVQLSRHVQNFVTITMSETIRMRAGGNFPQGKYSSWPLSTNDRLCVWEPALTCPQFEDMDS